MFTDVFVAVTDIDAVQQSFTLQAFILVVQYTAGVCLSFPGEKNPLSLTGSDAFYICFIWKSYFASGAAGKEKHTSATYGNTDFIKR